VTGSMISSGALKESCALSLLPFVNCVSCIVFL
jgi:hypothetical protein